MHGRSHGALTRRQVRRLAPYRGSQSSCALIASSRSPAHHGRSISVDPRIGVLRRHYQALHRRSCGGLVLLRDAQRARVNRVVARLLTGRSLPCVELGRPYRAHMGARAGAQVGVRRGAGGPRAERLLGELG